MRLGFTGTRDGMSARQLEAVQAMLMCLEYRTIVRHGDCVGADEQLHHLAKNRGLRIIVHPPAHGTYRAMCTEDVYQMMEKKPNLDRNHDIVDGSTLLLACPKTEQEQLRSGTWATVRYARRKGVPVVIVAPSGKIHVEEP